jgi:membrane-bound lytic murein transglycosylase D
MNRQKQFLAKVLGRHPAVTITAFIVLMLNALFSSQLMAATNAKGVEIAFLLDNQLSAPLVTASLTESVVVENNLWSRIEQGYGMPNIESPYAKKFENFYATRPEYVSQMITRAEKYLFYVVEEVEKRGMPTEIALLPMIESAYNPHAQSRSRAVGIWQFIPSTGQYFGLEQNWWSDHRRDVISSTQAALDYLEKLYAMFGSWDLALAAYNAGEGTVSRAIGRNANAGLATDYSNLQLPLETEQYVPKLQAIKNIMTKPQQFGLSINSIANEPYFAEVDPPFQIDAKLAAKLAEISDEEFSLLNPSYKRPIIASKNNTHKILLPIASIDTFNTNLANHDESLTKWTVYNAKRGENLAAIADKFNIALDKLRNINSLSNEKNLGSPLHLLVPSTEEHTKAIDVSQLSAQIVNPSYSIRHITHKIKPGETLSTVARKYGTDTRTLMKVNRLKSSKIKAGQIIKITTMPEREKTKRI